MSSEVAKVEAPKPSVSIGARGLMPTSMDELWRVAEGAAKAGLCPEAFRGKPNDCFLAMGQGLAFGWDPFTSLQNFYVHKGKLGMGAEAGFSLVLKSGLLKDHDYGFTGEGETRKAWFKTWRKGQPKWNPTVEYSRARAEHQGLYPGKKDKNGKLGPWFHTTDDMLLWKAVTRDLKRSWSDVIRGHMVAEPGDWYGEEINVTPAAAPAAQLPAEIQNEPDPLLASVLGENDSPAPGDVSPQTADEVPREEDVEAASSSAVDGTSPPEPESESEVIEPEVVEESEPPAAAEKITESASIKMLRAAAEERAEMLGKADLAPAILAKHLTDADFSASDRIEGAAFAKLRANILNTKLSEIG